MSNLKKLAGQTAIYGLSSILARSINFLMIFIYTSYLNKEVVGSFTGIYALIGFLNIIFSYGMETSFFRFSTGKNLDPEKVYNNTQSLLVISTLIFGSSVFLAAPWLAEVMDYPGQAYLFRWTALILSFDAILAIPFAKLRLTNRAFAFAGAKMINVLLNVFFNLLLIIWIPILISNGNLPTDFLGYKLDWGVEYILLANLFANGLIIPYVWWKAGFFRFSLDKEILQPMWKYAIPLLFMGLAGVTNELVSRLSFEYLLPENFYPGLNTREAAGIFGTSIKLAILMNLVIQAFKYAAEPFFFGKSTDKNSPQLYAQVMHAFIIFCSVLMIAISVNLDLVAYLFPKDEGYDSAFYIVPVLLMGYLLLGIYFNLSIWFKITDKTKYSFYITLVGAMVSLIVVFTLVPILGYLGGALSTLFCYLVMTVLCYYFGQKHFPIPYQTGKGVLYLLIAFGFSYVGFYLKIDSLILGFLAKNSLILLFIIIIGLLEKKRLTTLIRGKQTD
ncbi:lipopolysaccharide biosynthesis protein [Algoriphagus sp.]|uniref:lipopolysaccharide biosynthesis protein n=1 Tax=Algoriphagus sp. TaxID=1872435 RepID=UPI00391AD8AA